MRSVDESIAALERYVRENNVIMEMTYADDWHVAILEQIEEGEHWEYSQAYSVYADTLAEAAHEMCRTLLLV